MTPFQVQAIVTVLSPFLIQAAKASQLKVLAWINQNSKLVNVGVSFVTALLTNAGIAVHHSAGLITITYPGLPQILQGTTGFIVMTGVQFLAQHSIYGGLVKHVMPSAATPVTPPSVTPPVDKK